MVNQIRKLSANRNLLKNLILRDLKHRYVGSIGGFVWSVIHPIALLVSYTFIFTIVFPWRMGVESGTNSFAIFALCGILPWMLFSETLVRNCSVISENAALIAKTVIPAEILPISITISNVIHHFIGLGILLIVMVAFYSVHLSAIWILFYMGILIFFAQGLGWILAGLNVFVRDTIQALQIVLMLWFYFTPILYPITMLDRAPRSIQILAKLNPMAIIVTGYRNSVLNLAQPRPWQIAAVLVMSFGVFILGAFLFRQAKPGFADVL